MTDAVILGELPNNGFPWQAVKSNGKLMFINAVAPPRIVTSKGLIEVDLVPVQHKEVVPKISLSGAPTPNALGEVTVCQSCSGSGKVIDLNGPKACASCKGTGFMDKGNTAE